LRLPVVLLLLLLLLNVVHWEVQLIPPITRFPEEITERFN
jgi:hypothetical protein